MPGQLAGNEPLVAASDMHVSSASPEVRSNLSNPYRINFSSGEMGRMWPGYAEVMVWLARRAYPDLRVTIEQAYLDPADPALLWTCKHVVGTSRDGVLEDSRIVSWHRLQDDKITSSWEFMPIEPGPSQEKVEPELATPG